MFTKTVEKLWNFDESVEKLRSFTSPFLTVGQVAKILGRDKKTIIDWCRTGKLTAVAKAYGTKETYHITPKAVEMFMGSLKLLAELEPPIKQIDDYTPHLEAWKKAMSAGLMSGRQFSPHTINWYSRYACRFLSKYGTITPKTLRAAFLEYPDNPDIQVGIYRAMICFSKYLVMEELMTQSGLDALMKKEMRPSPNKRPKRTCVSEEGLQAMLKHCKNKKDTAILLLLANTGIRADECAKLKLSDVDLEKQQIVIRQAKWDKSRRLGINEETTNALRDYLSIRPDVKTDGFFLNKFGRDIERNGIFQRIEKLGRRAGIQASPHALRRRFVTYHLNRGENPKKVQKACGHSNIQVTMMYDQTSEQDVVDSMKNW
ncbi:MAG: tyrosine-type recombinase/integrase [Oligoflexales bacterium]